jgi:hypothetical protein
MSLEAALHETYISSPKSIAASFRAYTNRQPNVYILKLNRAIPASVEYRLYTIYTNQAPHVGL